MIGILVIVVAGIVVLILVIGFLANRYLTADEDYQPRHEALDDQHERHADTLDSLELGEVYGYPLGSLYVAAAEAAADVARDRWQAYLDGEDDQALATEAECILHPHFLHAHWWWYGHAAAAEAAEYHELIDSDRRAWRREMGLPWLELAEAAA